MILISLSLSMTASPGKLIPMLNTSCVTPMSIPKDLHYNWWLPPENVNQPPAPDRVQVGGAFRFPRGPNPSLCLEFPRLPAQGRGQPARATPSRSVPHHRQHRLPQKHVLWHRIRRPNHVGADSQFRTLPMRGAQPKLCILADRRSINQPCRWVLPSRFPFNKKHLLMLCLAFVDAENVRNASSTPPLTIGSSSQILIVFLKNSLAPGQVDDSPSWAIHVHLRPERWSPLPTRNPEPRRKPRQDARDPKDHPDPAEIRLECLGGGDVGVGFSRKKHPRRSASESFRSRLNTREEADVFDLKQFRLFLLARGQNVVIFPPLQWVGKPPSWGGPCRKDLYPACWLACNPTKAFFWTHILLKASTFCILVLLKFIPQIFFYRILTKYDKFL